MPIPIYFQLYLFVSVLKPYSQVWVCPILSLGMGRPFMPFRQKDLFFHLTFIILHLTGNCLSCRSSGIEHSRSKYFMVNVFYDISFDKYSLKIWLNIFEQNQIRYNISNIYNQPV